MGEVKTNSHGTNVIIKANILSDNEMRDIGFTDHAKTKWYYCRGVNFPKTKRYKDFEITLNVSIPKDGSELCIDVLDEDFLQPYDYQHILEEDSEFEPAVIVRDFVEEQMEYLQNKGVLFGHIKGEYI